MKKTDKHGSEFFRNFLALCVCSAIGAIGTTQFYSQRVFADVTAAAAPDYKYPHTQPTNKDMLDESYFQSPYTMPFTSSPLPPASVIREGKQIPFTTVLNDPEWKRPAYKTYWSPALSGGRWSHLTLRIHYALHRVFASYLTPGIYYDFAHDVGIWDEPVDPSAIVEKNPFEKMLFVVMQADVKQVYARGNQIVITAVPRRNGLHMFTINTRDVPSTKPQTRIEPNLVQLVTESGHEIDYWVV